VKPNSVIIRTLDIGGDKFRSEDTTPPEVNPFLGSRDPLLSRECRHLRGQLRAILRASAEGT